MSTARGDSSLPRTFLLVTGFPSYRAAIVNDSVRQVGKGCGSGARPAADRATRSRGFDALRSLLRGAPRTAAGQGPNVRCGQTALSSTGISAHIAAMSSDNDKPARRPEDSAPAVESSRAKAKKPKKDPAKPTRAKANRPDFAPTSPELEKLLNPGIAGGTAGPGPSTGIRPPADNSKDRRADFSAAHTARASTQGFGESPQANYSEHTPLAGIDPELASALGFGPEDAPSLPPDQVRGRLSPF